MLTVPRIGASEQIEFKITRGSLERAEANEFGDEMQPRTIIFGQRDTIFIRVDAWEDLNDMSENNIMLIIDQIPENTPPQDPIYFVGAFNDWYPRQGNLRFEKMSNGDYFLYLPKHAFNTEFKLTRGGWETVEVDKYGYNINIRLLENQGSDKVYLQVKNWIDRSDESKVEILITLISVPENTPPGDEIYIAGNFNNWRPGRNSWRLAKSDQGTYYIRVPRNEGTLEFKFTRGSWSTEEADKFGEIINNRTYQYSETEHLELIVERWIDIED